MTHGDIPDTMVIDHLDGNPLNNNISNLRLVTVAINQRNQKLFKNNKSGKTGVYLRIKNGNECWVATWVSERGKTKQKCFSVKKYPDAHILACEYRDKMILELNKEGYEYAERHGN